MPSPLSKSFARRLAEEIASKTRQIDDPGRAERVLNITERAAQHRAARNAKRLKANEQSLAGVNNGHVWIDGSATRFRVVYCRECGNVRRFDGKNPPCAGRSRIILPNSILRQRRG
jgi:hypothetical protein